MSIIICRLLLLTVVFVSTLLESCNGCNIEIPKPTPCGAFNFSTAPNPYWDPNKPYPGPGRVTLSFAFDPTMCRAAACVCRTVAFVQAIKFVLPPYVPKQPCAEQTSRMTKSSTRFFDGWAIDTVPGAIQPYYGMNNDGTFPFNPVSPDLYSATPGSSASPAILRDSPYSSDWHTYEVQVLSVPVCIDQGSACNNKILGYYTWGWTVGDNTKANYMRFHNEEAPTDMYVQVFDMAAQQWNNHLDGTRVPLQLTRLP